MVYYGNMEMCDIHSSIFSNHFIQVKVVVDEKILGTLDVREKYRYQFIRTHVLIHTLTHTLASTSTCVCFGR